MEAQRKIKPAQKRELRDAAGGKCANPGCTNWRTHIHHIKHWAVYKAHDSEHMIAVCPSCHDAIHYGDLRLSDETIYAWKALKRPEKPDSAHLHVEPARASRLRLAAGTMYLASRRDFAVFRISERNRLTLRILDGDILQISSRLEDAGGLEVLRVVENHVRVSRDPEIEFQFSAGHARVTVPATERYIPEWLIHQVRWCEPDYASDGRVIALDLEVLAPGLVKVQGFWPSDGKAIVVTDTAINLCSIQKLGPIRLETGPGEGGFSTLLYDGPITGALFNY